MRRQTLIALGVAIILGVVAVFLANSYLSGRERQLAASPEGMVRVAVATAPLADAVSGGFWPILSRKDRPKRRSVNPGAFHLRTS